MPYGDGGMLEDRLLAWLEGVPDESIQHELARIAPSCLPYAMTPGEIVRVLGVAGIAALANVRRSTVLQSAGPESCSIADLIESNPFGHLENASGGGCSPCACRQAYGPAVPGLGIPGSRVDYPGGYGAPDPGWSYPDPGYSVDYSGGGGYGGPAGSGIDERTPSGGGSVTASGRTYSGGGAVTSGGQARAASSASSSAAARTASGSARASLVGGRSLGPAQYGASYSYSPDERRRGRARRNPGGLTQAQEAATNLALEWGATEEEIGILTGSFEGPAGAPPTSSGGGFVGWPGAVPFRRDAWNFSAGWYILQANDTFSGLAATYLGSPARWMEIWVLQPYRFTEAPDPSSVKPGRPLVRVGERVIMPKEATDKAKELAASGAPSAPAIGGVGGTPKGAGAPWSTGTKVAIGVAVLGALGVGAYVYT